MFDQKTFLTFTLLSLTATIRAASTALSRKSTHLDQKCSGLAHIRLPNVTIYTTKRYTEGSTFTTQDERVSPTYGFPVPGLTAFCRFGGDIKTSEKSSVRFEVWLPENDWSGRFAMIGNGGVAGGVNYPDMGVPMSKYRFAVASTNTGHNGSFTDGSFAISNPESLIDFGHRAVHLTAIYSKQIIQAYYGRPAHHNYWLGCSSGGKQGLKELQMYPSTFDGVLAGCAAQWWPHLNAQTYRINAFVNKLNSTGYLATKDYAIIAAEVMKQCDVTELDKLRDNIITDPTKCKPRLEKLSCSTAGANKTACLSTEQIKTMYAIWGDWISSTGVATGPGGTNYFPGFEPGAEGNGPAFSVTGQPYGPGPDYYNYQIQNNTKVAPFKVASEAQFEKLVKIADQTDPGQANAVDPNIRRFLSRGKLLTYVGLIDGLIPTRSSMLYHERVQAALGKVDDSYRLFAIPGMSHCSNGPGAWNIGAVGQHDISGAGAGQSSVFDIKHDFILALIAWVEKGTAPDELIGASYIGDDKRKGVAFERKMCPWPKLGYYQTGDPKKATSFVCK